MNKIYTLKYSQANQMIVVVSELCHRKTKSSVKKTLCQLALAAVLSGGGIATNALAGIADSKPAYQQYRDFAENKGLFTPGATNIPLYDHQGNIYAFLDKAPMLDFSSANTNGQVAALISPQYLAGVAHNGGYKNVSFGINGYTYSLVDRNNIPVNGLDLHLPRLNKLVTEVVPVPVLPQQESWKALHDRKRYPVFYRIGSGDMYVMKPGHSLLHGTAFNNKDNSVELATHYVYPIGGTISYSGGTKLALAFNNAAPLNAATRGGDSGSPVYVYDAQEEKWYLVGPHSAAGSNLVMFIRPVWPSLVESTIKEDQDPDVILTESGDPLIWSIKDSKEGTGTLSNKSQSFDTHGIKGKDLNAGKNLNFRGTAGEIILQDSINMGAGALTFYSNYSVSPKTNQTWIGGGLDIKKDVTVNWNVNGQRNDNLHKIGEGTLIIGASGENQGGLRVGDGLTILQQRPDSSGKVQAFSSLDLSSGRPTVMLNGDKQIKSGDNITWGFRGGILDLNGYDMDFTTIRAHDHGARLINSNEKFSTITIRPNADYEVKIYNDIDKIKDPNVGTLYRFKRDIYNERTFRFSPRTFYFIKRLPTSRNAIFPSEGNRYGSPYTNENWELVGENQQVAQDIIRQRNGIYNYLYHGVLQGNINTNIDVSPRDGGISIGMGFDGDINTPNGTLTQIGKPAGEGKYGRLVFQGHPVAHAFIPKSVLGYNPEAFQKRLQELGDNSTRTQATLPDQPDWENRNFTLKNIDITDTDFSISRNATVSSDISAKNSLITIGDTRLFLDKQDSGVDRRNEARPHDIITAVSTPENKSDNGTLAGNITATDTPVTVNSRWRGGFIGNNSPLTVNGGDVTLTRYSQFINSPLTLKSGQLTALAGWQNDNDVQINENATLTLSASQQPAFYLSKSFNLSTGATLKMTPGAQIYGDIQETAGAGTTTVLIGEQDSATTRYSGKITAASTRLTLNSGQWFMTDNSTVDALTINQSLLNLYANAPEQKKQITDALRQQQPGKASTLSSPDDTATSWQPRTLTLNSLSATGSRFLFAADPLNNKQDQLAVKTSIQGNNNLVDIAYQTTEALTRASEQTLITAPRNNGDTGTLFSGINADNTAYQFALAHTQTDDSQTWSLITMSQLVPWAFSSDRHFSQLVLNRGGTIQLSDPNAENWRPHALTVDHLNARNVNFNLTARPQTRESDSITVNQQASGGGNLLNVRSLIDNNTPVPESGLVLASTPTQTPDDYFTINPVLDGLNLYLPDSTVISEDDRKKWVLAYRLPVPEVTPSDTTPTAAPTRNTRSVPSESTVSENTPSETTLTGALATETPLAITPDMSDLLEPERLQNLDLSMFNRMNITLSSLEQSQTPESILKTFKDMNIDPTPQQVQQVQQAITRVTQMVQRTENLASLPGVSFVQETNQLNKRLGDVRQLGANTGAWIKISAGRAEYLDMNLHHSTLQLGLDKKHGNHLFGAMASYTRGSSQGLDLNEKHTTGGAGVYYSWIPDQGLFFDVIAKYLKNHQNYQFPTLSTLGHQSPRSTTLLGSMQLGYQFKAASGSWFVEPSVEVVAGRTSGYVMQGRDIRVITQASTPIYSKTGLAAGVNWQSARQQGVSVSLGAFRLQNLKRGGAVDLYDSVGTRRHNPAAVHNSYLLNLSVNARISAQWRLYSQIESNVGGKLKRDLNGQIGVRYQF